MANEQQHLSAVDQIRMDQTLTHLIALTALSEQDYLVLRNSAARTQLWAEEIVADFHNTLLAYQPTAELFWDEKRPDRETFLHRLYLEVTSGDINADFWQWQWHMGQIANLRRVKSPFTFGIMSHLQQLFLKKCSEEFEISQAIEIYNAFKRVTDVVTGLVIKAYYAAYEEMTKLVNDLQNVILPLGIALLTEKTLDKLLEKFLKESKSICNADAGTLYLYEDGYLKFTIMFTDSLNIALGGTTGKEIPFPPLPLHDEATGTPNTHNMATYVALEGHSINIPDICTVKNFDISGILEFDRVNNYQSRSLLTVPLKCHGDEVIGILQLFNAQDPITGKVVAFNSYQQLVVESLASQAAVALDTKRMIKHEEEFAKVERDLHIGHQIQVDFLPSPEELPQPEGWEIATYFHPAREVAGDFFDAFPLPGHKVGIVIADVVDKGVGAAIFMALSRSLIRAFAQRPGRPTKLLDSLTDFNPRVSRSDQGRSRLPRAGISGALSAVEITNNYIAKTHGEMCMFATLFLGVLDPNSGVMHYINGGHDAPIFVSPNGEVKARLNPTGPAVGMMPDMDFEIEEITFQPGDLLMTFSDGVTDARNPDGERFTPKRLLSFLEQAQPVSSAADLLARLEAEVHSHIDTADQFDDITMLAVRRVSAPENR